MTTETKTSGHMTFNSNVSFDMKMVVSMEHMRPVLAEIEEYLANPEKYPHVSTKGKIFCNLIMEGKTEEERVARFVQYKMRESLNETLRGELATINDDSIHLTASPVKFRFVVNEQK